MDGRADAPVIRREILQILQDAVREQRGSHPINTYVSEWVVQRILARRNYVLMIEALREHLLYLLGLQCVRYTETHVTAGGWHVVAGEHLTPEEHVQCDVHRAWRIESRGTAVLEGTDTVPGVARA